ncbi:MAG TPA: beta-ketoacyl synthase N-terminal-like domain-containing protein, partial [Acidimicrobiales bacterium]|nr:beta-ketoacyl synthase N-terminal-like domain-containing protein [Acidimicrobiales bacterium]
DTTTRLAVAAGFEALRDAGIPLVMRHRTTSKGTRLPDRWVLPEALRDETGVIFASAFPGLDAFADESERFHRDHGRRQQLALLEDLRAGVAAGAGAGAAVAADLDGRIAELRAAIEADPYQFDRRFLFKVLAMGHSQFAELIGARGPNTHVNAACAGTTQALAVASDWIRAGRCRRVVVVAGDDVTSDHLLEWMGAGFLASGAAATDEVVEEAALPFDNRRHGMILGMGAAALVVESAAAARERGVRPICEVLGTTTANSAFHGTRLDVDHIASVMEDVVAQAEAVGLDRRAMAPQLVFVSHETYTPARGGSAAAEVTALRKVFGEDAPRIVVANTKGFTGHPMGVGIEDVVAVKALETGIVPPVANFRDVDPGLGELNLSQGGAYPVEYALRLAAGFGSQISMALLRREPPVCPAGDRPPPDRLGYEYRIVDGDRWQAWLAEVSGQAEPTVEVVQRRLRVAEPARPTRAPAPAPVAAVAAVAAVEPAPAAAVAAPVAVAAVPEPVAVGPEPVAVEPAPAAAPVPPESVNASSDMAHVAFTDVEGKVLALVAEKTGYPPELLDLDLDLEADLGIDTVKQAEMFAAIREAFAIPRDDDLRLRDYPTLAAVIGFVRDRAGSPAPAPETPAPAAAPVPPESVNASSDRAHVAFTDVERDLVGGLAAADAVPRRVPVPALRPPLAWCRPTGVALDAGSRVVVVADQGGAATALAERLEAEGVTALVVEGAPAADELVARIDGWLAGGPVQGVYWLPALDAEGPIGAMDPAGWREANRVRVKLLYATMRRLYDHVAATGTFLVCATRLGGRHGYDEAGATAPLGGAVTGFAKA